MSRKEATKRLLNICKNIGIVVIPISIISGIVQYFYNNKAYTIISVLFSAILIYLIWLELRIRELEKKKNGKE